MHVIYLLHRMFLTRTVSFLVNKYILPVYGYVNSSTLEVLEKVNPEFIAFLGYKCDIVSKNIWLQCIPLNLHKIVYNQIIISFHQS